MFTCSNNKEEKIKGPIWQFCYSAYENRKIRLISFVNKKRKRKKKEKEKKKRKKRKKERPKPLVLVLDLDSVPDPNLVLDLVNMSGIPAVDASGSADDEDFQMATVVLVGAGVAANLALKALAGVGRMALDRLATRAANGAGNNWASALLRGLGWAGIRAEVQAHVEVSQ